MTIVNASELIALCSLVVAVTAVAATIYQARLSHRHDKLTVQPFLAWGESFVQEDHGTTLSMSVENCGQGPAIIKDRWFEIDGKRFDSELDGSDLVAEVARRLVGDGARWHVQHTGLVGRQSALPAGARFVIAQVFFPGIDRTAVLVALKGGPEVDLLIEHESLHRERTTFSALHGYGPRPARRSPEPSTPPSDANAPQPTVSRAPAPPASAESSADDHASDHAP